MDSAESDFDIYCSEISLDKDFLNADDRINFSKHPSKKYSKKNQNSVSVSKYTIIYLKNKIKFVLINIFLIQ